MKSELTGLTVQEAALRLRREGYNELPGKARGNLLRALIPLFTEPMVLVLFACSGAYFLLGDRHEAWVLLASVALVSGITLYQEYKTERTLEALKDLSSPRALVIRSGSELRVPGREVTRGDILVLQEGDRVPADASLLESFGLQVDESLLTGESVPIEKRPGDEVFSGTMLTRGRGFAEVARTGPRTELGKIGKSLQGIESSPTSLQLSIAELAKRIGVLALLFCLAVTVIYGKVLGDWLKGVLAGLTLAVSLMPEELPVILTIFFSMGAWRISKKNVLTRKLSAIETLGSVQILGTDKTGTLTINKMTVKRTWAFASQVDAEAQFKSPLTPSSSLTYAAWLACPPKSFDPMDRAVFNLHEVEGAEFARSFELLREYPLTPELLAVTQVWKTPNGTGAFSKGAPEHIASLCRLTGEARATLLSQTEAWAKSGLRVLGVASAVWAEDRPMPSDPRDIPFQIEGLMGFVDPPREGVPKAIGECQSAGIRVVMITGDHPATAAAIAKEIGLSASPKVMAGAELSMLSEAELPGRIVDVDVFARISPEQKLRIVRAHQFRGKIVGMTGDGVNDGPSLKAAHIGIAMGGRGTDLAREASNLVVLDDNFATIVDAIRLGRTIFSNIKKAVSYVVAIHIPIAGVALLQLLFPGPMILMPIHVVFLELIIDPACSLVFEAEAAESDIMRRVPRSARAPLLSKRDLVMNITYGILLFLNVAAIHYFGFQKQLGEEKVRTLCFAALVTGNLALILTELSRSSSLSRVLHPENVLVYYLMAGALGVLLLAIYVPMLNGIFRFVPVGLHELGMVVFLSFVSLVLMNTLKRNLHT